MNNKFTEIMARKSDSELLKIVNDSPDNYQKLAFDAAKIEFEKRDMSDELIQKINTAKKQQEKQTKIKSEEPLATKWKVLTFFFPGLIQILFSLVFAAEGYDKKRKELVAWTIYGVIFYSVIVLLGWVSSLSK